MRLKKVKTYTRVIDGERVSATVDQGEICVTCSSSPQSHLWYGRFRDGGFKLSVDIPELNRIGTKNDCVAVSYSHEPVSGRIVELMLVVLGEVIAAERGMDT